jgi:hypothetical protein
MVQLVRHPVAVRFVINCTVCRKRGLTISSCCSNSPSQWRTHDRACHSPESNFGGTSAASRRASRCYSCSQASRFGIQNDRVDERRRSHVQAEIPGAASPHRSLDDDAALNDHLNAKFKANCNVLSACSVDQRQLVGFARAGVDSSPPPGRAAATVGYPVWRR